MRKIIYLSMGIIFCFLGCQKNSKLTDSEKGLLVKAVKEKSQQFWSNTQPYDTGSFRKFIKFWDDNSDGEWQTEPVAVIFNTGVTKTRAEWVNNWKKMIDSRISTNPTILESHFTVLAGDKVLEVNTGDFSITMKDSTVRGPYKMVNTIVWINRNGDWKMQFFHESTAEKSK
jgi:hypothetical protein